MWVPSMVLDSSTTEGTYLTRTSLLFRFSRKRERSLVSFASHNIQSPRKKFFYQSPQKKIFLGIT